MADRDHQDASTLLPPPAQFDLPAMEREILDTWTANDAPNRSLQLGAQAAVGQGSRSTFVFYDGPPFATGLPHYGHILAGTIKDIIPRYKSMRGFAVERRFGWDCHGLPIESLVEEELNVHGKAEIEALGIAKFNGTCRAGVLRYTEQWEKLVRRLGRWVDFDNDYKTMDLSFMESVWWVMRRLWDQGLVYEGHRVQPVSPALGTPLSNFEVAQGPQERDPITRKDGHRRRQDPSLTVRFRLEDEAANLWAWTTTPWTLPSNLALAVHPDLDYVKVRVVDSGEMAWLEPSRLADYQARGKVGTTQELARIKGRELVGRAYEPLFPYFAHVKELDGRRAAFRVVAADYVSTDAGTGIVHQAPAFGEEDFEVGKREGLPLINPVNLQGVFDERVPDFAGQYVKDADKHIVAKLKAEGKVVDQDTIVHPYPHCYRTEQPLLYMALSTWFVRVEQLRDQLIANNELIHWVPDHVGSGRFGNWLASARDWNVARNRYWGTPIPIWRCDLDPNDMVCIGSVAELEELAGLPRGGIQDLHRECIDEITFASQKTPGGTMHRVPEVFDCWFESGSMPYAQNHYPFEESKRSYVEHNLPADFIAEGLDQTRGWFYTLHVLSTALFGRPAFKNVIVNGLILAEDGKKMSKRLRNYPDPLEVVNEHGADALRAYLISSAVVRAEPMRFAERGVRDTVRTTILPLWNAYNFLTTYANADGWSPTAADLECQPAAKLDRWILSRLSAFVEEVESQLDNYALFNVMPATQRMCDDLNNWYIRRGRRRYWRGRAGTDQDKQDAYATLFRTLVTIASVVAPVLPFVSDWLYQRLVVEPGLATAGQDSVHLAAWPDRHASLRDVDLENRVAAVRAAVALGLSLREQEQVAVRRPLAEVTIASPDAFTRNAIDEFSEEILGELNVKALNVVEDDSSLCAMRAKANFKTLGKRLGNRMKEFAASIAELTSAQISELVRVGWVELGGESFTTDEIIVSREALPGRVAQAGETMTLVLETNITPELRREGLARELINRIQNLRKDTNLTVSQRIEVVVSGAPIFAEIVADPRLNEIIATETLAAQLQGVPQLPSDDSYSSASDTIDGDDVTIGLRSVT